jgi:hypothetical protein
LRDSAPHGVIKDVNEQRQHAATNEERKIMKKTILLAIAAAGIFTFTASAQAGEPLLSPKAQEHANSTRKVPGTTPDMIDRSIKIGSPKALELAQSVRKVPSTGPSVDLAHAPRPTMSPKDPRYEVALRANAASRAEVQIAPLK